jgi:hypothetical protein
MMKTIIIRYLLLAVAVATLSGCTHNDGDIGDLFGTWKLTSMTVDGADDTAYQGNIVWKFQSSILQMQATDEVAHTATYGTGTWSRPQDGILSLDFTHTDKLNPEPGSVTYSPLPATHLPAGAVSRLTIDNLCGGSMTLTYVDPSQGTTVIYNFKKW